jgi:hypothetical protein
MVCVNPEILKKAGSGGASFDIYSDLAQECLKFAARHLATAHTSESTIYSELLAEFKKFPSGPRKQIKKSFARTQLKFHPDKSTLKHKADFAVFLNNCKDGIVK